MTTLPDVLFLERLTYIIENNNVAQWSAIIKLKHANKDLCSWIISNTFFLPENSIMTARIYCIQNSIIESPLCHYCKKPIKFRDYAFGFNKYCGSKCAANCPDQKVRRENTCLEKYGTKHYLSTKDADTKRRETNLEKYGVENVAHMDDILERKRAGSLKKYGQTHHMKTQASKDKVKETNIAIYGMSNPMNRPEILAQNKEKFGSDYFMCTDAFVSAKENWLEQQGVTNTSQIIEVREKKRVTMCKNYGVDSHMQRNFTNMEYWTDVEFIKNEFIKGKRVDYTKAKLFFNASYPTLLYHFKNDLGLDIKNTNVDSEAEREIVQFIRNTVPDIEIVQNSRRLLKYEKVHIDGRVQKKYKEIDIYLPEYNLAIEYDGLYWHSIGISGYKSEPHDIKRLRTNLRDKANLLQEREIKFLNIWENEWSDPFKHDILKGMILDALGKSEHLYAKECQVVEIDRRTERNFLVHNHIQGDCLGSTYRFGLEFEGILVAIMTFGCNVGFKDDKFFDLLRFSTLLGYRVLGGASKLLKHFLAVSNETELITYVNRRWSSEKLFEQLGFTLVSTSNPNYYYFDPQKIPIKLLSKTEFQKNTLKDKLLIFDPALTEQKNMFANGYRAVFDAGQAVYKLTI